jgi:ATP-dependent helicase HrpB
VSAGRALLEMLGALAEGSLTEQGRQMSRLGAHPRLAAMMLAAQGPAEQALACDLAALLEERDPLRAADASADIALRLGALAGTVEADRGAVSRIRRTAQQYRSRLGLRDLAGAGDPGRLIAAGFPDRVAQRRGEPGSFRLAGGGGAKIPLNDPLSKAPLLAVASLEMKLSARIRLAAPLDPQALVSRSTVSVETGLDPATGSVLARRRRRFGALVLEDRTEAAAPHEIANALARAANIPSLAWTEAARQLQARVAILRGLDPASWPDWSDVALAADRGWLADQVHGVSRLADLEKRDVADILRANLAWEQHSALDRELPSHLALPGGRAAIDYTQPVPVAEARAQAFFGLSDTPRLASGRVALRLALLSPAQRPVAITTDLGGFWRGAWADVKKDMRGRYPRHHWPDDPATASFRKPDPQKT